MKQRTFLITGASKGIGRALSNRLAAAGHQVVGVARRADDPTFPGELVSIDLSDRHATQAGLEQLVARYAFDGVVNNVGFVRLARIGEIDIDTFEKSFLANLTSAVQATQAVLPSMKRNGWGRIINVSSLTILGVTDRTIYAGAKSALASFTRTWALELAEHQITVNTVAPGPTETELFRENNPVGGEGERRYLSMIPLKRLGKPDELGAAIAFLMSEDASFITGQTLFVDGGASIGRAPI